MLKRVFLVLAMGAVLLAMGSPVALTPAAMAQADGADEARQTEDVLILSSGQTVRGQIIEETADEIRIRVTVGSLSAETTYPRTEVIDINRDQPMSGEAPSDDRSGRDGDRDRDDEATWDPNDDTARIYYVEVEGLIPHHFSKESLIEVFEDVDETFGDVTTTYIGADEVKRVVPEARDKNIVVFRLSVSTMEGTAFRGMYTANDLAPIFREEIDQKGRRVVFWVDEATQGGVFVPLTGPELYFAPSGFMGGIGSLDEFKTGDTLVDEKLIGAMLGQATGYVIRAGYGEAGSHIVQAMARPQYFFAVNTSGGRADTMLREPQPSDGPNWRVISSPGQALQLDDDLAQKLNISRGTVSSIDDLAFELGIERNYKVIEDNRAVVMLERWADDFREAIEQVNTRNGELWIEHSELIEQMNAAETVNEYNRYRGQAIRKLRQIRSVIGRFADYLDPNGQWRASIDVDIEVLRQMNR
jgi:hypothetical protein